MPSIVDGYPVPLKFELVPTSSTLQTAEYICTIYSNLSVLQVDYLGMSELCQPPTQILHKMNSVNNIDTSRPQDRLPHTSDKLPRLQNTIKDWIFGT